MSAYQTQAKQYQTNELENKILNATPHEVISLLLAGAKKNIARIKLCIENKKVDVKGDLVSKTISIVSELKRALNLEAGGEIAENLDRIYDYILRELLQAHVKNDLEKFDEIYGLLNTISEGWDGMKTKEMPAANDSSASK